MARKLSRDGCTVEMQKSGDMKAVVQKINQLDALAEKVGGLAKLRKGLEVLPQLAASN